MPLSHLLPGVTASTTTNEEDCYLAHVVSTLCITTIVLCIIGALVAPLLVEPGDMAAHIVGISITIAVSLVAIGLSRTRHFRIGGVLLIASVLLTTTYGSLTSVTIEGALRPLQFSPAVVFLTALLFNTQTTIAVASLLFFVQLPLVAWLGISPLPALADVMLTDFIFSTLIAVITKTKERHLKQIRSQQEHLIASSKMSSLGEMASGIAHEINSPLAIISLRVKQLLRSLDVSSQAGQFAIVIEKTTARIAAIVQGLHDFSQEQALLPMGAGDLQSIVNSTLVFCSQRFKDHCIELLVDPVPAGLIAYCRPTQISQILLNLLNNAHDAAEEMPTKWVRITVSSDQEHLCLSVSDSGKGVDASSRQRIFEPFYTTKSGGKGTGLGLSISASLAHVNEGKLELDPDAEHTTFVLTLKQAIGSSLQAA